MQPRCDQRRQHLIPSLREPGPVRVLFVPWRGAAWASRPYDFQHACPRALVVLRERLGTRKHLRHALAARISRGAPDAPISAKDNVECVFGVGLNELPPHGHPACLVLAQQADEHNKHTWDPRSVR